jgi:hypothetical protein
LTPCRSSQRLTGQLVTNPSIIPICIRNQWLELSIARVGRDPQRGRGTLERQAPARASLPELRDVIAEELYGDELPASWPHESITSVT